FSRRCRLISTPFPYSTLFRPGDVERRVEVLDVPVGLLVLTEPRVRELHVLRPGPDALAGPELDREDELPPVCRRLRTQTAEQHRRAVDDIDDLLKDVVILQ